MVPVRVYQKHEAGHSEGVLSEEGYHTSLVGGRSKVGSEEGIEEGIEASAEGVSWECSMLSEL